MGDFLRRYWHPVATIADLTSERPIKRVRILSEVVVLFRDKSGRAALIPERCPHEGASMLAGAVTEHGITCLLHGWTFDTVRMCSVWDDDTVSVAGYPVREHAGLYWAYLGSDPAPPLPTDGILGQSGGRRRITVHPPMRGNWLDIIRSANGLPKRLVFDNGNEETQAFVLPAHLHVGPLWLLTPMEQEQTMVIAMEIIPSEEAESAAYTPEIVVLPPGERNPNSPSAEPSSFFAPWGSVVAQAESAPVTEMLYKFFLDRVAATGRNTE
jgi:nitrite reductase/ring-hydroxylating ferredoxin subunit